MNFPTFVTASEAATRFELEARLSAAVASAVDLAMRDKRRGVLVTRHHASRFTVELSLDVPYGMTFEDDQSASRKAHGSDCSARA